MFRIVLKNIVDKVEGRRGHKLKTRSWVGEMIWICNVPKKPMYCRLGCQSLALLGGDGNGFLAEETELTAEGVLAGDDGTLASPLCFPAILMGGILVSPSSSCNNLHKPHQLKYLKLWIRTNLSSFYSFPLRYFVPATENWSSSLRLWDGCLGS